jgi:hypothetical protein
MSINIDFKKVTGITESTYEDSGKTSFGVAVPNSFQIHYASGSNSIYYSFDGKDDHGVVGNDGGQIQTQIIEPFNSNEVWLRGGTGDEVIHLTVKTG